MKIRERRLRADRMWRQQSAITMILIRAMETIVTGEKEEGVRAF
jgi:hypothetical protein